MLLIALTHLQLMNPSLKKIFKLKALVILQSIFILKKLVYQCTKTMSSRKAFLSQIKKTRCLFSRHPTAEQLHPRVFCMFLQLMSSATTSSSLKDDRTKKKIKVDYCYQHTRKTTSYSGEATLLPKRKKQKTKETSKVY